MIALATAHAARGEPIEGGALLDEGHRRGAPILARRGGRGAGERHRATQALFWPAIPVRNLVFLAIAMGHGLRRVLPPW